MMFASHVLRELKYTPVTDIYNQMDMEVNLRFNTWKRELTPELARRMNHSDYLVHRLGN